MIKIYIDCSKNTLEIKNNYVMMGTSFFELGKISYIGGTKELNGSNSTMFRNYDIVCDGVEFSINHRVINRGKFEQGNSNHIKEFDIFKMKLIDTVFGIKIDNKKYI